MGSNCCKGDANRRPIRSSSSIYSRSRAGASLDERFTSADDTGGVRLTVSAARTGDTDLYTLQASNAAGTDTAQVRLEVSSDEAPTGEDPPTFLRRLQDLTVKVGTRTRFLVEIISSTECKVTWYRNERRLLEAERVALARDGNFWCADVTAVSVDDAGRWTCTAENAGGRASCSAHLNVLVPKAYRRPEFVEELRALLTEQGTVSLECKVVGVPTPVLRWFKDSREIKAGDVFALTANAEDPTSLGTYTCEAVNCMGRAYSSSKVHVVGRGSREGSTRPSSSLAPEPPPIFTKELEDQFVRITDPLTLSCHIVVPPWPRSVVWYNKEGKVEPGDRYHVLEDGAGGYLLEIPSAEWPDEGEWKCVACSSGGRVGISTCYVTMDVPKNYRKPRFMENLQAVLTEEGLVSFECKVVGFPTPVLSWFKDGQELKPGDVYQLTGTNSLGSYCCIAKNCMGQASSSAELTVEDIQNQLNEEEKHQLFQAKNQAPKFIQGLKSVEAKIDEPFRFTVKVAIPPEPSVLWYRDDQPVDESSRCHHGKEDRGVFYLDIQTLEFLDQAEWKCVAMNDFGHSVTSCFLKLIIPRHYKKPRFLENLQAILSEEGAVNLECKVIGVPQPVLKWYKDGEELKPGDIHRIISGQDGTCCLGTYTCEAQNCMGIAASSASLLGFDDSMKAKKKKAEEQALQRNLSLSTIHEERTSQMYDTPVGDITLNDDKGEISFSFDGKEVSVSLYETPDLTEEEALQIVEMYADQLSENITEHNVVELPPLRFVKETSTSGNLLMEAVIIDVSPDYFQSPDEDLRTEADVEDLSIADENAASLLSLEQDDIGGEDYLEKTMALLSEEKSDLPHRLSRKKSDSQRSADDFFSLSRDQSLSEDKRDDDTQPISESDMPSFASAHSSGKPKSKSSKPSGEDGQESSEPTKTILFKDEAKKHSLEVETAPAVKPKRERKSSRGSRRSSSGSEKSVSKSREEALRKIESFEMEVPKKPKLSEDEFKQKMANVSASLSKMINDVQIIERDIILKSELMSSAATASRSLEIISSLISPLSEIHSIADAAKEAVSESKEVSSTLFNKLPQPLKALQQSLTIIEKCIDMESDSKTLVKKTCVAFIETCGPEMQKMISEVNDVTSKDYLTTEDRVLTEIESLNKEMSTVIKFSADTIKARNLITEASDIKVDEPSQEVKHLRDTQKAIFELKGPLTSLLRIAESADSGNIVDVAKVTNSEVILNDISGPIQDLQTALEQIESLSVKEETLSLHKYNTEIIETVMESVVKLRTSFEQLSTEARSEDKAVLKQAVSSIKENLSKISSEIDVIENNIGSFDVLASDNKLDALQKMAQILIALENNLPKLETMPEIKNNITVFHKDLTKVLENVIESNESKKYFALMEICDGVNRINDSIKNLDVDPVMPLASLNNTLRIIQDQFVKNVFDSELNCSILSNISDTLVGVREAINSAEEISMHIESEHIEEISPAVYDKTKATVIFEHIDHTIAAIENVKTIEATQELKLNIMPTLQKICPVLEELKRSVAAIKASGIDEEHVSEISEVSSFAQTLATPLCELNNNIMVLNQQIVENIESMKDNSAIMATVAEPLHELHNTLEILQQDVVSQYGEDISTFDVSANMASAVQSLQSCIVMIQEQAGVEAADEMSTLEDISGIKTTADTIPSDRLILPTAEETAAEQGLSPFEQEPPTTTTAQALQSLNEHIVVMQTPEIIDALDTLSEVSDFSSLKSFVVGLGELHTGIEEVFHPILMEGSNEIINLINPAKLTAIAEPMQELQQSLSVLDTSNIPIYENILEMPTEKIHSVIQTISEFKEHLDNCMLTVFPAMQTADDTVEIANKVGALREVCEHLKDIINTSKTEMSAPVTEEVKSLEDTVDNLLDATDVSKGIKIDEVKTITEKLYEKVITVQEEMIQFTPQSLDKLAQEAKLIQTIDEVQSNIAVLEQYDFVDLSRASEISCTSPQMAIELESDSLAYITDIVDSAVAVVQDSAQETPLADLMIVEDFFKTCKNEFTILRCLITKATSHKKIIRLLQEFNSLQRTITDFKTKRNELNLSDEVKGCLATFLIHADDCLRNVQVSLEKIVESQAELLINAPLVKFENSSKLLEEVASTKQDIQVNQTVKKFTEILEIAKPTLKTVQVDIVAELKNATQVKEDNKLLEKVEEFATFIEETKAQAKDANVKDLLEKVSTCIEKHHDYKDATGTGKSLILMKCLSDCTDILQENLLEIKISKPKLETGELKTVLTEMLEPLQALHTQLVDVQEQVLKGVEEDSISVDISTTESLIQTVTEKHKEIVEKIENETIVASDEISLMKEVDKEIHSIEDSLKSIESTQVAQVVKDIAKPVEEIKKSLQTILSSENVSEDKLPTEKAKELIQHIDQYIELIEIIEEISAIIRIEDVKETMEIAKELRESISVSELMVEGDISQERATEVREEQARLAHRLQTALSALQVQVLEGAQELAPELSTEVLQRIAQVTAQLEADLVAVTGVRVAVQAPSERIDEVVEVVKASENQMASVCPGESAAVAISTESTVLEQEKPEVEQPLATEQLIATTEMLEMMIADTKEVATSGDVKHLLEKTVTEPTETLQEADALQGTEIVPAEHTIETPTEIPQTINALVKDAAMEVSEGIVLEEKILQETTTTETPVDVHEGHAVKSVVETPKALIATLMLHIDQYISEDISEVINELSSIVDADELRQSVNIAKELRENIAASEVELKAEASDVQKEEVSIQQAQLAQQLHTALATLENLPFDTLGEISSINKETLQKVAEITTNLQVDLATVIDGQSVIDQTDDIKQEQVKSETAQLKASESEAAVASLVAEQISSALEGETSIEPTKVEDIKESMQKVQTAVEDARIEIIEDKELAVSVSDKSEPALPVEVTAVQAFETEVETEVKEIPQNLAITTDIAAVPLEEVALGSEEPKVTEQAVEQTEESLKTAIIETLLHNINEFLSENVLQTIGQVSATLKVDELYQSVAAAQELHDNIMASQTATDKIFDKIMAENKEGVLVQKLHNALSTIQVLVTDNVQELKSSIDEGALQHLNETVTTLSSDLSAVASQVVPQLAPQEKDVEDTTTKTEALEVEQVSVIKTKSDAVEDVKAKQTPESLTQEVTAITDQLSMSGQSEMDLVLTEPVAQMNEPVANLLVAEEAIPLNSVELEVAEKVRQNLKIIVADQLLVTEESIVTPTNLYGAEKTRDQLAISSDNAEKPTELQTPEIGANINNDVKEIFDNTQQIYEEQAKATTENISEVLISQPLPTNNNNGTAVAIEEVIKTVDQSASILENIDETCEITTMVATEKVAETEVLNVPDMQIVVMEELTSDIIDTINDADEAAMQLKLENVITSTSETESNLQANVENLNTPVAEIVDAKIDENISNQLENVETQINQIATPETTKSLEENTLNIVSDDMKTIVSSALIKTDEITSDKVTVADENQQSFTGIETAALIPSENLVDLNAENIRCDIVSLEKVGEECPAESSVIRAEMPIEQMVPEQIESIVADEQVTLIPKDGQEIDNACVIVVTGEKLSNAVESTSISTTKDFESQHLEDTIPEPDYEPISTITNDSLKDVGTNIETTISKEEQEPVQNVDISSVVVTDATSSIELVEKASEETLVPPSKSEIVETKTTIVLEKSQQIEKPSDIEVTKIHVSDTKVIDEHNEPETDKIHQETMAQPIVTEQEPQVLDSEYKELTSSQEIIKEIDEAVDENIKLVENEKPCEASVILSESLMLPETQESIFEGASKSEEPSKPVLEHGALIEHIDEFISSEISGLVEEISSLTNYEELKQTVELAKGLKESIELVVAEEASALDVTKEEQAKLAQKLQDALSVLHTKAIENAEELTTAIEPDALLRVSEIITHLQADLDTAIVAGSPQVLQSAEIVDLPETEENSMQQLKSLLQEVTDKISVATVRNADDTESLKDALDEVQTVIIKLKRDYDGAANDTLNETLEDLECSVRSVQLQINEDSPPELLREACATLQLLVDNMSETKELSITDVKAVGVDKVTIMQKCSTETDETVKILEVASKIKVKDDALCGIINGLNVLKDTLKTLKLSFTGNADILIEKGVSITQSLDILEDQVFALEKEISDASINVDTRDSILTAIHSVYGSISNMRGTISSVQKSFMFENYGKPSEALLRSIKNISLISSTGDIAEQSWKNFSKSLRKVHNHFEDIKFYINLDKTARLPSDAAFTKIILEELKLNIGQVLVPQASILGEEATTKVNSLLECVNKNLLSIESNVTLEVKKKIPIFKEITSQLFNVTEFLKTKKDDQVKGPNQELLKEQNLMLEDEITPAEPITSATLQNQVETATCAEIEKKSTAVTEKQNIQDRDLKKSTGSTEAKGAKQVRIQETPIELEIEQIALDLVSEIAAEAIAKVQTIKEFELIQTQVTSQLAEQEYGLDESTSVPSTEEIVISSQEIEQASVQKISDDAVTSTSTKYVTEENILEESLQTTPENQGDMIEFQHTEFETETQQISKDKKHEETAIQEEITPECEKMKQKEDIDSSGQVKEVQITEEADEQKQKDLLSIEKVEISEAGTFQEIEKQAREREEVLSLDQQEKHKQKDEEKPTTTLEKEKVAAPTGKESVEEGSKDDQGNADDKEVKQKEEVATAETEDRKALKSKPELKKEKEEAEPIVKAEKTTKQDEVKDKADEFKDGRETKSQKEIEEEYSLLEQERDNKEIEKMIKMDKSKKVTDETGACVKKEKEQTETKPKDEAPDTKTKKEKEVVSKSEVEAKQENEDAEDQIQKGKDVVEAIEKGESEDAAAQAKNEKEQTEFVPMEEKEVEKAMTRQGKSQTTTKKDTEEVDKEETKVKSKKDEEGAEAKENVEKLAEVAKAKEEKETTDAKAQREEEQTVATFKKENEETEKKIKEEIKETKAHITRDKEEAVTKIEKGEEETELKDKKEKDESKAEATKENEEYKTKEQKNVEAKATTEKEEPKAKSKKEKTETETKEKKEQEKVEAREKNEQEKVEAKATMEKEAEAKSKKEKKKAEVKEKKELEKVDGKATTEEEEAEVKSKKEKKETEGNKKKELEKEATTEKEETDAKATIAKDETEAQAEKEQEEAEATDKIERDTKEAEAMLTKQKQESEVKNEKKEAEREVKEETEVKAKNEKEETESKAKAKKEKEEHEAKAKNETEEAEAKAKKDKEEAEAKAKKEKEETEAKVKKEAEIKARKEKDEAEAKKQKEEATAKTKKEKKETEETAKIEKKKEEAKTKEEAKAKAKKEKDEAETKAKKKEESEAKAKREEAEAKIKKEKKEAEATSEKEKKEAKAKKEKEETEAKAKTDKEEAEAKAKKEMEETEARAKKEAEIRAKKEKDDAEAKKQTEEAEAKAKKEMEKAEAEAKREKKEEEAKTKAESEAKAKKEKIEAEAKAKKEIDEAEAKAEKEREEAETKVKKEEADAKAKKDKEEAEAKAKKEKKEAKAKKEKEETEDKVKKEKEETEAKAKKDKEEAEAKAKKEKEETEAQAKKEAEIKAKKEKDEAEAKKQKEEDEAKDKQEKEEIEATAKREKKEEEAKTKAESEAKAKKEKIEAEAKAKKDIEEAEAKAEKEREEAETKVKKEEAEAKAKKDKAEAEAKAEKEKKEAKAKKDKEETEAKVKKEKEETEAKAKKDKEEAEAKAKKEKEETEAKVKKEAEIKARKEKDDAAAKKQTEEAEAKAKKEKEMAEAKAKREKKEEEAKTKEESEAKAKTKKERIEAEAKAKKEIAEAEAKAEKEREEAETKVKKEEAEAKAKKDKEEAQAKAEKEKKEAKAKKDKEETEAKGKKETEDTEAKAKNDKEEAEAKAKKEMEETEVQAKKEAEIKAKKEKDEPEAKKHEVAEAKDKQEKEEIETTAKREKKEEEAKTKAESEAKAKKEKIEAEAKAKKDIEEAEAKAEKEREEAETKVKKEQAEAKAKKDKAEAEAKAEKEKKEDKAKKDKEETEAKVKKEKEETEAKAKKDKEEADAKAKKEKEETEAKAEKEAEIKAKKEKDDAEAKKQTEEAEAKAKKEKEKVEAKAKREKKEEEAKKKEEEAKTKEESEAKAKAKREKIEAEAKAKKEIEEAEAKAEKEREEAETKVKKEAEAKAKKDKDEAKAKKEKKEAKAKNEKEETEAKAKKEIEESEAKAKIEREEAETKAKKEENEAKAKKETAEAKAKKDKEEAEAKAKKEKAETEAKAKKEAEIKAIKEKEETEAKAQKDKEEAEAKAKKEKEEAETKAKKKKKEKATTKAKKGDEVLTSKETEKIETNANQGQTEVETKDSKDKVEVITKKKKEKLDTKDKQENYAVTENEDSKFKPTKAIAETDVLEEYKDKLADEVKKSKRSKERHHLMEQDEFETKKSLQKKSELIMEYKRGENGDIGRRDEKDDHYIKEYQYEPTRQKTEERTKFVDHNRKDYTMDFARPSGYRERTFDSEKYGERESTSLGKNATIYKAQTIVLDAQLRSSMPPATDRSESERRADRHRSKALSEVRSLISEKRSGLSRDLKRKPVFSTYLTDRTAVEGSRVKLTCSVLSSSDPKITWYKNGVVLDNKLKYRTKFMDGLITLEVLNALPSDSAEYSCTVENENGSVNTSANLKVYPSFEASPIPPTFTRSIRDNYHLAENELILECRIRGQPLPTITWLKDDRPITSNERYQAFYLADGVCRLAISSPTPEDSGKYTCKAENSVWSDQITHVVSFTGKESRLSPNLATIERSRFNRQAMESRRPHFTNVLSDYKVAKGGTIGLQVEIRGCPTRVEWLREGRSVTEVYRNAKTFVEQGLYTLALSDVTEKESGMYTCRAWSTHGNVDMNAAITVVQPNEMEGKPAMIVGRPEKDILISVGEDVNISFRVQGEPKPKVVFMKGIRDITNNQRVCKMTSDDYVKYTLKRSIVSDAGTYCVLARNAYGCDRAFVTVVVRQRASSENLISDWTYPVDDSALSIAERKYKSVPDRIPGEPTVVDGGNNWASLAWPKSDPGNTAPVLAYKIESWLLGKEGGARWTELGITPLNSFDVFNLKQGEEYHFRVTPRNRYGWGESVQTSSPIGIGLAGDRPEFVDILPGQLKVLVGETAHLSCSVKGKPWPEVVWMKNGHEIEEEGRVTTAFNGQSCSLTIRDINAEDEARYSCEASNVHGRASTYARLAVVTDKLIWEADVKLKRERSQDAVGEYPPQFTMRLRDRRVQATYPVRLTCQVVGNPPPSLTWFKDGQDMVLDSRRCKYQDEHFHTLEIAPTTLEDGGVYEAMARNSSGAVSCRCSLVVDKGIRAYVAPEFCCGLEPLYRLGEGEELRISAVVEAYPSVGVTWYRDGVRLRPSRRAIMTLDRDGQIELALASVTARDAGVYTCTASNEVGRASTSGKVEIIEGEAQHAKRTPPIVIHTPDVPYSKEPMFTRKPRSSEAREGDTVIIQCEVIGDPKPDVYWLRDFLKPDYYRDATHFKRVGDGPEYRFEIPHAKLDYTGAYSVVARNVHGEAKAIISLQILAKDPTSTDDSHNIRYGRVEEIPRFERELQDLLSYDGDAVEFECRLSGNPEPDIKWFHYSEVIRECPDFECTFEEGAARLKIKQVTAEDEGTYTCEAFNNLGKASSSACLVVYPPGEPNTLSQRLRRPPALLSAASTPRSTPRSTPARSVSRTPGPDTRRLCSPSRQMAPSFYTYPFNKVVEEGDNLTFQCAVKGLPAPWATWDKDGIIITPSARITIKEKDELLRILEIEQVSIEDVGVYRITIENEYGRAEASARLEVITQKGKFYGGVRPYSASPRKSLTYRRYPSSSRD